MKAGEGPRRAVDRVTEQLRADVLDGTLAPGERIGEANVAANLGVSRTPVREALGRLAAEGLLELQPNRGARVATWSSEELNDIFELRLQLEPRAARLATSRIGTQRLDELSRLAEYMLDVGRPGKTQQMDKLHTANRQFHDLVVESAEQPALAAALSAAVNAAVIRHNYGLYDTESMLRSLDHHRELVRAMRVGDPDWAEAIMRAHLSNGRAALLGGNALEIDSDNKMRGA